MPNAYEFAQLQLSHKSSVLPANLIEILFAFLAASVFSGSFLIHSTNGYITTTIKRLLCYGKYAEPDVHEIRRQYEVPKRWFAHFYVVAVIVTSITLILTVLKYFYDSELPHFIHFILDVTLGPARIPIVSPESTMTAIFLLHAQSLKRLYETCYVSVYSDAKMNLSHYAAGFIHYIGSTICIIGESYGFVQDSHGTFRWSRLKMVHFITAITFLIASYEQFKSNIILANLRKDEDGVVITKAYKIPYGRLFEYISAPLQFTEIIMYLMLTITVWESSSFHYVFIWVVVNQDKRKRQIGWVRVEDERNERAEAEAEVTEQKYKARPVVGSSKEVHEGESPDYVKAKNQLSGRYGISVRVSELAREACVMTATGSEPRGEKSGNNGERAQ